MVARLQSKERSLAAGKTRGSFVKYKGVASLFSAQSPSLPDRKSRSQPQIIDDYSEHSLTKCAAKPMNNSTIEYNSKLHTYARARKH